MMYKTIHMFYVDHWWFHQLFTECDVPRINVLLMVSSSLIDLIRMTMKEYQCMILINKMLWG